MGEAATKSKSFGVAEVRQRVDTPYTEVLGNPPSFRGTSNRCL